jgi:hypothetical protein
MASHYNCSATIPTRAVPADTRYSVLLLINITTELKMVN